MSKLRNAFLAPGLALGRRPGRGRRPRRSPSRPAPAKLNTDGKAALDKLYAQSDKARAYGRDARAILVFPRIVKAGLVVSGQSGEGVLFVDGQPAGYYRLSAASLGLQAGGQTFGYALFLMNDTAVNYLRANDGWAIGTGPSMVVVDAGAAAAVNTTTERKDIYAFPFDQKGPMAGIDLEGSKITRLERYAQARRAIGQLGRRGVDHERDRAVERHLEPVVAQPRLARGVGRPADGVFLRLRRGRGHRRRPARPADPRARS